VEIKTSFWRLTKLDLLVSLLIFVILLAVLVPMFINARNTARESTCACSMKMLWLAFDQYTQDYNGKLPPADKWSDAVNPYAKYSSDLFNCPEPKPNTCDFSFSSKLDRKVIKKIPNPTTTPMLFESDGGWNSALPITKAVPRHFGGYNCCYVDGHVKLIKPAKQ
jgi:prepilin-type processing-associated H-X9-DG protein